MAGSRYDRESGEGWVNTVLFNTSGSPMARLFSVYPVELLPQYRADSTILKSFNRFLMTGKAFEGM